MQFVKGEWRNKNYKKAEIRYNRNQNKELSARESKRLYSRMFRGIKYE